MSVAVSWPGPPWRGARAAKYCTTWVAVIAEVPVERLRNMIYANPTVHRTVHAGS
ncbi:hypothetical protein B7755_004190 [Streptomyces sp. NBS 14/10]|uniref:hypothetical protein n=1 Tax=Streptomyces sp. NBS 14/10 TaxID=1945643 RepID=UPI0015C692D0|nr:hypothetical protein [Streptomyces sp. NBS 14/10]KAK1177429.1 hypothetical protein B7755_004190 [Streptomyces sp. NBS 14/10]NUP43117.1 hypothetical protein [Streptomyces sp.]NUS81718.1 hypothetical protein [Streptomyces sp.]